MGVALLILSLCRLLFFTFNYSYFGSLKFSHLWGGIRFDWMTICILYAPFFLLLLIDFRPKSNLRKGLFHFSNSLAIIFNCIDFEYFKFTFKRTTADLFQTNGLQDDVWNLLPSFAIDYWYIIILTALLIAYSEWLYRKTENDQLQAPTLKMYFLFFVPVFIFYVIGFRGGLQYRPLNVIQAGQYAQAQNIPIVLNSPFTILKSAYKAELNQTTYFDSKRIDSIYSPILQLRSDSTFKPLNVVLIIAESFSKEYIGAYNKGDGFTPFLDSLMGKSLVFNQAFANGKKSIEALPSILAGIPTLMNTSYISSKYGSNRIEGLGSKLSAAGYRTVFYHGGENGTMGFDAFARLSGIQEYVGKNEYPYKGDYDGNWGIFDEPFLQHCVQDLSQSNSPFFATIFTLSSHHPYTVPAKYESQFKEGPLPILKSVRYADFALQKFFNEAKKKEWFQNTLFVITADHTSQSYRDSYNNRMGMYSIPLIFYSPKYISPQRVNALSQQNDIYPSILDFLNWNGELICFGNSVFNSKRKPFVINYINELYQYVQGDYVLHFDGENSVAFYNFKADPVLEKNLLLQKESLSLEMEIQLKAILQQYYERLTQNSLVP